MKLSVGTCQVAQSTPLCEAASPANQLSCGLVNIRGSAGGSPKLERSAVVLPKQKGGAEAPPKQEGGAVAPPEQEWGAVAPPKQVRGAVVLPKQKGPTQARGGCSGPT